MKKILKYILRTLLGIILLILLLVILAALITQTGFFKRKLPSIIEKQASAFLNGSLTVGRVDGNLFTNLLLEDVLLSDNSDTVIYFEELSAHYNLLPLLHSRLEISSAKLSRPFIFAQQLNDSTWNLQQIVKPVETAPSDTANTKMAFTIELSEFVIEEGSIEIESPDTIIPRRVEHLNTNLSLQYASDQQKITINSFSLHTQTPDLMLESLTFQLTRDQQNIQLKGFNLKTAQNQIDATGEYHPDPVLEAQTDVTTGPLHLTEFEFFLPEIKIPANPIFELDAVAKNDSLLAKIDLADGEEKITLRLNLANFPAVIYNHADSMISYKLTGTVNKIHLERWSGVPTLDYILSGDFKAEGTGISPETAVTRLTGDFRDCVVEDREIAQLDFALNLKHGNLDGSIAGAGSFGKLNIRPEIQNLMGDYPRYKANIVAENLNLAALSGIDTLESDLNLKANVSGRGFDPKTLSAKATLIFSPSKLADIDVDTLFAKAAWANENVTVDSLRIRTQTLEVEAYGNYSMNAHSDLVFSATLANLNEFKRFIPLEGAQTSGKIDAHLWGAPDSVHINALVALGATEFDSIYSDSITLDANALLTPRDTMVNASLSVNNLWNASFQLDSVTANLSATPDSAFVEGDISNHDLTTGITAGLRWGEKFNVRLDEWAIQYKDQKWFLQQPPARFEMDSTTYTLENFALVQSNADSTARIAANGTFSMSGDEDFKLELANIDIAEMASTFYKKIDASGQLNLNLALQGDAALPEVKGGFEIKKPVFNKYKISEFGGEIDYAYNLLKFSTEIIPRDSGSISISGELPVMVRLDSIQYKMNPKDSISANLNVDRFPLAVFQAMEFTKQIEGYLQGEVEVNGTVENPDPNGSLQLKDAALQVPEYGIKYRRIDFKVDFLRDKISVDTLMIQSPDGNLTASGQIDFSSDFYKGDISNTNIEVKLHRFNPVDHKQLNMEVSGNASLTGKKGDVVFSGDLNIPEAEMYLPFVMNLMGRFNAPEMPKPILLRELKETGQWKDTIALDTVINTSPPDSVGSNYFDAFTGKLRITIPKNTWVKNEDFRVELSGDLELRKNREFFELFGTVDVVRGQYDLFGRTFVIEQGTISFQGGDDIQPEMNITANYTFRNAQKAEQELQVNISGTANSPKVSFTLDGRTINEGDAISYILFGKSMNELTLSQQDNMSGNGGSSLAGTAAASLLSSQITKFLGNKLNVDYIEVKSSGSFENATVTVGKYITNDLFVNYEQQFGETTQKDVDRYRVELEYELFKFLFIQLTNSSSESGFNVIIKLDSE